MEKSIELVNSKITMSSLEIAELTNKEHRSVLRDIRSIFEVEINAAQIRATQESYGNNNTRDVFHLDKEQCIILLSGYSVELRKKIIHRWQELERRELVPMSLEEMTLMVVQGQQNRIKELEGTVVHKQKQIIGAKGGHTKEKNRLKKVIDETQQKAKFYENLAEERKRLFWWNR